MSIPKYCIDANVFINAWYDIYPPEVFDSLYPAMVRILKGKIYFIKPVWDEIDDSSPVHEWLRDQMEVRPLSIINDNKVNRESLRLEGEYKVSGATKLRNIQRGADGNDMKLIAHAVIYKRTVVTMETYQSTRPQEKSHYKIPLICEEENILCIDFLEMLKQCKIKI